MESLKALAAATFALANAAPAAPWSFGLISDTQWPLAGDSASGRRNPNSVAADIIRQVDREFARRGVKFVVAVGDVTDNGSAAALDTRATMAQELYNRGIGFFPLRGNHEASRTSASEFVRVFPQTRDGVQNRTPEDAFNWTDSADLHMEPPAGGPFKVGSDFSSPSARLAGLSYSFRYANARIVMLDQFAPPDGLENAVDSQLAWIGSVLSSRPSGSHAFVFSHKGLITQNHPDGLFGSDPSKDTAGQNAFVRILAANGVRCLIGGHDHMHNRSLVATSNDPSARVQEVVLASDSYKFYQPRPSDNDSVYDLLKLGRRRETPIAQRLYDIGYYIATVDGPDVEIEFHGVPSGLSAEGDIRSVPPLDGKWSLREKFGYSLLGKEFVVPQGRPYAGIADTMDSTRLRILGGTNTGAARFDDGRPCSQLVGTSWSERTDAVSRVVRLRGLEKAVGTSTTPVFALALSAGGRSRDRRALLAGEIHLASPDSTGHWVDAVSLDSAGSRKFMVRAWKATDSVGTWGIDPSTSEVWAVVDHGGDFALVDRRRMSGGRR